MKRRFEMLATVSEWTDPATGRKCKRTVPIGTVFESDNGKFSARLELIPVFPGWSGFVAFREVMPPGRRVSPGMPEAPERTPDNGEDDDIPF